MISAGRWTSKRVLLGGIALLALGGLWFAFRPEKLFTTKKVNEAAPTAKSSDELQPLLTGRFVSKAHPTSGRATVYRMGSGGRILRLSDFSTSNGPAVHVVLIDGHALNSTTNFTLEALKNADLGDLKGTQGDQEYSIPDGVDLHSLGTVSIYCERFHVNFATASLEDF